MASTPNHAAQGGLITLIAIKVIGWLFTLCFPILSFFLSPLYAVTTAVLVTLGAMVEASADLFGQFGGLYKQAHQPGGYIYEKMKSIPVLGWLYRVHPFVDGFFHEEGNVDEATGKPNNDHWWPEKWYLEVLLWGLIGTTGAFIIFIFP